MKSFFKALFKELSLLIAAKRLGYYSHIDYLPVYNWFQLLQGNFEYLYKKGNKKECPEFFKQLPLEMLFQFDKVEMNYFESIHKLAYLKALFAITGRIDYLNKYRVLEKEIENDKLRNVKPPNLNDMLNYIEETFKNIGVIDVHKMSTSRFFALYQRAIEKNKQHADIKA